MAESKQKEVLKETCGVVMPISAIDGCSEAHWGEVLSIVSDAIEEAGFEANLVSNADDVGIIQKRIIQNLYLNPVVVCDVSGKNANVMFELGLRLAFDKPTIIIKDDKTTYSFDTAAIEHLEYPRDLRFSKITEFKQKLSEKIKATHEKATSDPEYTTFLKHFGEFKVAKIDQKEVSGQEFIIDELRNIKVAVQRLERSRHDLQIWSQKSKIDDPDINICFSGEVDAKLKKAMSLAKSHSEVVNVWIEEREPGHPHLMVSVKNKDPIIIAGLRNLLQQFSKADHSDSISLLDLK